MLKGGASSDLASVNTNKQLEVVTPRTKSQAGYVVVAGESHDGAAGEARLIRPMKVSPDGRARVGVDNSQWREAFNHAQQDFGSYNFTTTTATIAVTGGFLAFNTGNSVASGAVARVQTFKTFELPAFGGLEVIFRTRFTAAAQLNNVCEMGLGIASGTTTPTDGVYFKLTAGGDLVGVINVNGTETTTAAMPTHTINAVDDYRIVIDQAQAEFYINGVLRGVIDGAATAASISLARSLPLLMRFYNSAATSSAQRMEIAEVGVITKDIITNREFAVAQAGMGMNAVNVAKGVAAGQTANYANSAAPASATLSNTAAGYTTLGGQFQFAAVAGAETDYALFALQVPATAAAGANKNLVITGVKIDTINTVAAVATTATVMQWALGVGSTAVSLATSDSNSTGARQSRRIPLGIQSFPIGAAVGAQATGIAVTFDSPLYVDSGTFVHLILKMPIATATATEIFRGVAAINGYWE